jgi:CubicO group peptidase (beta-lactamase class C family)
VEKIWELLDRQVASGRMPGYVAALRIRGDVHVRAGGRMSLAPDAAPMDEDAMFRIASITKPIAGALALGLVQDGLLALDDPIARWLPEAANPRVLVAPDAPLDHTVDVQRPITVRHLLTMTSGWGIALEETPLQAAMLERNVFPGPIPVRISGDEYLARITDLPLACQPGDGWRYDSGTDILSALLPRACGKPVGQLLAERVTGPLGMASTSFCTSELDRLATAYQPVPGGLEVLDPPGGAFASPPLFERLSGGLLSTAGDVLRFFCAMADGGEPVLSADSVALLTADALTDEQRRQAQAFIGPGRSWGLGTALDVEPVSPWMARGRWGWEGGTGTTALVDPTRDTVAVLLTQRALAGPQDSFDEFWAAVATLSGITAA